MKIVSTFHVPIFYIFLEISRQKALRPGWAGRFIVLKDSASPNQLLCLHNPHSPNLTTFSPTPGVGEKVVRLGECGLW